MESITSLMPGETNAEALQTLIYSDGGIVQVEGGKYMRVLQDEFAENPLKDWDYGFFCTARKWLRDEEYRVIYSKDDEGFSNDDFSSLDEIESFLDRNDYIWLRVCAYIHGGISLSEGLSCPWDSGVFGYIYVSKEEARRKTLKKRLTKNAKEEILNEMRMVMTELDHWLNGECYEIQWLDKDMEVEESMSIMGFGELEDELEIALGLKEPKSPAAS